MEIRLSSVLLAAALLSGCGWFHRGERGPVQVAAEEPLAEPSIIEPQVNRRVVKTPKIKAKDYELGGYFGALSIQDFGTNPVYGARAAYHVSEDIFVEGYFARSKGGWRICVDTSHDNHPMEEMNWRPITEWSVDIRLEAVPHLSKLRELVLKAAEECVPTFEKAIADIRSTMADW